MHRGFDVVGSKPGGDFFQRAAIGVVEVVTCGKQLDRLRASGNERVQQTRVQTLLQEDMRADGAEH